MNRPLIPSLIVLTLACVLGAFPAVAQNENETVGFSSTHVFDGGYFGENVDVLNGNLNLNIPIGPRYRVTSEFSYQLRLYYNSKIWSGGAETGSQQLVGESPAGVGFSLHLGKIILAKHLEPDGSLPPLPEFDAFIVTPDGNRHGLVDTTGNNLHGIQATGAGATYFTNDGTYMRVVVLGGGLSAPEIQSWVVYLPDGTTQKYQQRVASTAAGVGLADGDLPFDGWYVTQIESRERCGDGAQPCNHLLIDYNAAVPYAMASVNEYRDGSQPPSPPARQLLIGTGPCEIGSTVMCITSVTVPAFNGSSAVYQFSYDMLTITSPIPGATALEFPDQPLLTQITFPEDYSTRFEYADLSGPSRGEINARIHPTGAVTYYYYSNYTYISSYFVAKTNVGDPTGGTSLSTRAVWRKELVLPDGPPAPLPSLREGEDEDEDTAFVWRYARLQGFIVGDTWYYTTNPYQVTVSDPFGNDTVYYYNASLPKIGLSCTDCAPQWDDGTVARTDYYQGASKITESSTLLGVRLRTEETSYESDPMSDLNADPSKNNVRMWKSVSSTQGANSIRKTTEYREYAGFGHYGLALEYGDDGSTRSTRTDWRPIDTGMIRMADVYYYREVESEGRVISREDAWFNDAQPSIGKLRDLISRKSVAVASGAERPASPVMALGDVWTQYDYDTVTGNLLAKTAKTIRGGDAGGHDYRFGFTYQAGGYLASQQVQDPTDGTPVFAWLNVDRDRDPNTGLVVRSRAPYLSGQTPLTTSYNYDLLGRLTGINPPYPEYSSTVSYPTIKHTILRQSASTDDLIQKEFFYNDLGALVTEARNDFDSTSSDPSYVVQHSQYDANGFLQCRTEWSKVLGVPSPFTGDLCSTSNSLPKTTYDYGDPIQLVDLDWNASEILVPARDPFGRQRKVTTADGKIMKTSYAGEDSIVTVEGVQTRDTSGGSVIANFTTTYRRDAFGRLRAVEAPPDSTLDHYASATYLYDALDNLIEARITGMVGSDLQTQVRVFEYDALKRLVRADNPENGTIYTGRYDALGNVLQMRDMEGNVFAYTYDAAGRLLQTFLTTPGALSPVVVASNSYDTNPDTALSGYSANRLVRTQSFDDAGQLVATQGFAFTDLNGRLGSETTRFADVGIDYKTTYTYNLFGMRQTVTYPTDGTQRPLRQRWCPEFCGK